MDNLAPLLLVIKLNPEKAVHVIRGLVAEGPVARALRQRLGCLPQAVQALSALLTLMRLLLLAGQLLVLLIVHRPQHQDRLACCHATGLEGARVVLQVAEVGLLTGLPV